MSDILETVLAEWPQSAEKPVRLQVTNSGAAGLHRGHPWLYVEKIVSESRPGQAGDLAVVFDGKKKFVAVGLYDPFSPIRMRALRTSKPGMIDRAFFAEKIAVALSRRSGFLNTKTDGYRLIYGESDGFPGLVVDRYAETGVVKLYSLAWLPYLYQILTELLKQQPLERLVLRMNRGMQQHPELLRGLCDGQIIYGPPINETLTCLENGLRFEVDPVRGQKTGFFLDQRDNRAEVERLARGKRVLNVFSYNGGFSLAAARGGAVEVTSVDQSGAALESSQRNFDLNADHPAVKAAKHLTIEDDAFNALAQLVKQKKQYDLVIIDPPAFAVRRSQVKDALNAYAKLAHLGVNLLVPGGDIVLASCSSPVTREEFRETMCAAAQRAGRPLKRIRETGHACDHPTDFSDCRYLKCLFAKA